MSHVLLLGAGFSRNYGGWLADELTGDIMGRVSRDAILLSYLRDENGFEAALESVRNSYQQNPTDPVLARRFFALQDAITASFIEMNTTFEARGDMEFQKDPNRFVQTFLARFDVIFSLNQDLLLERLYRPHELNQHSRRDWHGIDLLGMSYIPHDATEDEMWIPTEGSTAFEPRPGCQPLIKLHGSVKWLGINDQSPARPAERMLIMGTNKAAGIERSRVLSRYFKRFEEELARPGARLMVIGYGFRDNHINSAIANAGPSLETFIVDPIGRKVLESLNVSKQRGVGIRIDQPIEQIKLIGVSRRQLSETFGNDQLAWNQLTRFFQD